MKKCGWMALLATLVWPVLAAEPVKVASKIDTEGALLGQMILQVLQAHDVPVEDRLQLGTTQIVRQALISGEVDIYPEYTGNGAFFSDSTTDPAWKSAEQGYEKIRKYDAQHHQLQWLTPAPANNTWAIAVSKPVYQAGVVDYPSLAHYLADGGAFKLAASAEFVDSAVALPAFQKAYGFQLDADQLLVLSGGNTAATIRAAAQGSNGVNAAMVYGTDGAIAAAGLQVIADPKHVQPVYAPAPVVREAVLAEYPDMSAWLKPVFLSLDRETLQRLNAEIQVEGKPAKAVAEAYLRSQKLL